MYFNEKYIDRRHPEKAFFGFVERFLPPEEHTENDSEPMTDQEFAIALAVVSILLYLLKSGVSLLF